jgi:DNA-directed RNA polymerase specialized sigma24 family protein
MNPEALFRENLPVIDRVCREVCRAARLRDDEAEDFSSSVRVALMENGYAILRKWEGRSSLAGFLWIVIRRLLADHRDQDLGRWRPSAEASRLGPSGVLLEKLLIRDRRPFEEALPIVIGRDPTLTDGDVAAMAGRLPPRHVRLRAVALDDTNANALPGSDRADARALSAEARRLSARAGGVVRRTIGGWPDEDAMILRFHYASSMTVADISRMLRTPQRPLYRRIEEMLASLRAALVSEGLDAHVLFTVIGEASQEMDFGFDGKKDAPRRSVEENRAAAARERE